VWLHLPLPLLHLANEAVEAGFSLHHASPGDRSLVLCAWLEDSPSRLPPYASHQVGVSGVVWREDTDQLLTVQDKYKFVNWKFPGGLAEPTEDIADAVVREVREETGVLTEFRSVLAFRQHHHMPHYFGCSDLYFVCRLHPLTFDLHPCEKEVVKCEWMGVRDLATSPESTLLTQQIARLILDNKHDHFAGVAIAMEEWPSVYKGQTYKIFLRTS
jgi:8-oxo-dGTP pyrophosphatase MutT (NUDIX family)